MNRSILADRTILVAEDEALVALEIVQALTACGAHVVSEGRLAGAVSAVALGKIDAAIVDINLAGEDGSVLCEHLSERRIPFVFYTGYATAPDQWSHVPIIRKPADLADIVDAVEQLCASHKRVA